MKHKREKNIHGFFRILSQVLIR